MPENAIRVMIVDDDVGVLRSLTTLFQRGGHQVIPIQDATEALGSADEETPEELLGDASDDYVDALYGSLFSLPGR